MEGFPRKAGRVLIMAPHPDDEVLGCGGTIARLTEAGSTVDVAIVTVGKPPRYDRAGVEQLRAEATAAHALLGVGTTHYLDLPAAELDGVPHADLNAAIGRLIDTARPDTIFVPFVGDIHLDHQLVFRSTMVAARPRQATYPRTILAYETLSESNWSAPYVEPMFAPTVYVDIEATLDRKLERSLPIDRNVAPFQTSVRRRRSARWRWCAVQRSTGARPRLSYWSGR